MIQKYKSKSWKYMVLAQGDRASIVFTDEKDYSLDITKNRQNDHVYRPYKKADIAPISLYHGSSRFSKKRGLCRCFWAGKNKHPLYWHAES